MLATHPQSVGILGGIWAITFASAWYAGLSGFSGDPADFYAVVLAGSRDHLMVRSFPLLIVLVTALLAASVLLRATAYLFLGRAMVTAELKEAQTAATTVEITNLMLIPTIVQFQFAWQAPLWFCWVMLITYMSSATAMWHAYIEHDWLSSSTSARTPAVFGCWLLVANIAIVALFLANCETVLDIAAAGTAVACDDVDGHCAAPDPLAGGVINGTNGTTDAGSAVVLATVAESGAGNSLRALGSGPRTDSLGVLGLALIVLPENIKLVTTCVTELLLVYVHAQTKSSGFICGISTSVIDFHVRTVGRLVRHAAVLVQHVWIAWLGGFSLGFADVIIYLRIRGSWSSMMKTVATRANHGRINKMIDANCPQVCDPDNEDPCAICWEEMPTASVLPCKHQFHRDCLRTWLSTNATCPTCRCALPQLAAEPVVQEGYWWGRLLGLLGRRTLSEEELTAMTASLVQLFPHISPESIARDLALTGSADVTAERILQGTVV